MRKKYKREGRIRNVLLSLAILWISYHFVSACFSLYKLEKEIREIRYDILKLKIEKTIWARKKELLESPLGIESVARTRLGMEKQGERSYRIIIVDEEER